MQAKKVFNVGDKSRAVCEACQTVVATTFELCDLPFSDGSGVANKIMAGVCDQCGTVVSIPAQSTPVIAVALKSRGKSGDL